jgi:hypothetical protein
LRNRAQRKDKHREEAEEFLARLEAPRLLSGAVVTGQNKEKHRIENKKKRVRIQEDQPAAAYWTTHEGLFSVLTPKAARPTHKGSMCPSGLATLHPAPKTLLEYATKGCPAKTGRHWTLEEMEAIIANGPHVSALQPDAMAQLQTEVAEKENKGAVRVVLWEDLKRTPLPS